MVKFYANLSVVACDFMQTFHNPGFKYTENLMTTFRGDVTFRVFNSMSYQWILFFLQNIYKICLSARWSTCVMSPEIVLEVEITHCHRIKQKMEFFQTCVTCIFHGIEDEADANDIDLSNRVIGHFTRTTHLSKHAKYVSLFFFIWIYTKWFGEFGLTAVDAQYSRIRLRFLTLYRISPKKKLPSQTTWYIYGTELYTLCFLCTNRLFLLF